MEAQQELSTFAALFGKSIYLSNLKPFINKFYLEI